MGKSAPAIGTSTPQDPPKIPRQASHLAPPEQDCLGNPGYSWVFKGQGTGASRLGGSVLVAYPGQRQTRGAGSGLFLRHVRGEGDRAARMVFPGITDLG